MEIQIELREILEAIFMERCPKEMVSEIEIISINLDHETEEIHIDILIGAEVKPDEFAKGFFGLTRLLRDRIDEKKPSLSGFFPVIIPRFVT